MQEIATVESNEIVPFEIDELKPANIAELKKCCDEMVIGSDGEGYEEVKEVHIRAKKIRTAIKERHKVLKADALKVCQDLDDKKRKMNGIIEPIIDTLAGKRKVWDDKVAAIEEEKRLKEKEKIDRRVVWFRKYDRVTYGFMDIATWTDEEYETKLTEAKATHAAEEKRLADEEAKRKSEAERLEKQRKEQAETENALNAEKQKIMAEQMKLKEDKEKLEAEQKAEADRKEREEFERKAKEQAEKDAKEKLEREAREAEEEAKRQEALKPDRDKLIDFANDILNKAMQKPILENDEAIDILDVCWTRIAGEAKNLRKRAQNL